MKKLLTIVAVLLALLVLTMSSHISAAKPPWANPIVPCAGYCANLGPGSVLNTSTSSQNFSNSFTFPANSLVAGTSYDFKWGYQTVSGATTDARSLSITLGGATVWTKGSQTPPASSTHTTIISCTLYVVSAGVSGSVNVACLPWMTQTGEPDGSTAQPVTINTSIANTLNLAIFSGTTTVGDTDQDLFFVMWGDMPAGSF